MYLWLHIEFSLICSTRGTKHVFLFASYKPFFSIYLFIIKKLGNIDVEQMHTNAHGNTGKTLHTKTREVLKKYNMETLWHHLEGGREKGGESLLNIRKIKKNPLCFKFQASNEVMVWTRKSEDKIHFLD